MPQGSSLNDDHRVPPLSHGFHEGAEHIVQFYESDDRLCERIADFLWIGLDDGDALVVVATEAHRSLIAQRLQSRSLDIEQACSAGRLLFLDAEQTLKQFMVGGRPNANLFQALVGGTLEERARSGRSGRIRAFGEMVDVLWRSGNRSGAIELEELWNDLKRTRPMSLLCAYALASFYKEIGDIERVCDLHDMVRAPELGTRAEVRPEIHVTSLDSERLDALAVELDARGEIERTLRQSIRSLRRSGEEREARTRRLERLARITAPIADAVTRAEVHEALVGEVGEALGASSTGLWVLRDGERAARLVGSRGYTEEARRDFGILSLDDTPANPTLDSIRRGRPVWIDSREQLVRDYPHLGGVVAPERRFRVVCVPIVAPKQTIGALVFTFDDPEPVDDEERSLFLLVARYAGQALERLSLLEAEQESRARTERLYRLARAVIGAASLEEVLDVALDAIQGALCTDRAAVLVAEPPSGAMRFKAWRGLSDAYRRAVDGHSPWSREARDPEPFIVSDVETDASMTGYRPLFHAEGIGALAFIPLCEGGRLIGKFMVYYQRPRALTGAELDLARGVADHVAAAIARFTAVAELQRTVHFNETFTGILGHDLRNPLAAIMTSAHLALSRDQSERLVKPLSRILNSGERMTRMIDQLLDFTRVRLGAGIPLARQPIDLVPLLRQILDELDDPNSAWTFDLQQRGDSHGTWDPDRLSQVFSNLAANAVQHGVADAGVTVVVDGTDPDVVRASVRNAGVVPERVLPLIFEPLATVTRPGQKSGGLGLGLYITREIVRAHGGRIDVASSAADGATTFMVTLPRGAEPK